MRQMRLVAGLRQDPLAKLTQRSPYPLAGIGEGLRRVGKGKGRGREGGRERGRRKGEDSQCLKCVDANDDKCVLLTAQ